MVRLAFALLLFAWLQPCMARISMDVQTDRRELVLGQALTLQVTLRSTSETELSADLDLDALKPDYEVYSVSRGTQTAQRKGKPPTRIVTVSATLYPLHSGELSVPALHYLGVSSKPLPVTVRDSGASIPRVLVRTGLLAEHPFVRQATVLYLDIYDDGLLIWSPPGPVTAIGAHLRPLKPSRRKLTVDGENYVVQRYAWAFTPLQDGALDVRFPMLEASRFGEHLRYAAPVVSFAAQRVPAYLPVYVPIGRPAMQAEPLPAEMAVKRPLNWQLAITGSGVSEEAIVHALSATIRDGEALRFYPPSIQTMDAGQAGSPEQSMQVRIPFEALQSGDIALPEVILPYYDPVQGEVSQLHLPAQRVHVVDPFWQTAGRLAWALVILALGAMAAYLAGKRYRQYRRHKASLARIAAASRSFELKEALLALGTLPQAARPATLQQWLGLTAARYERTETLPSLLAQLERACYGRTMPDENFSALKQAIEDAVKQLRRKGRVRRNKGSRFNKSV